jgi:hypothetical protein
MVILDANPMIPIDLDTVGRVRCCDVRERVQGEAAVHPNPVLKSSTYYMNNRKAFTKINSLLYPTRANWKPRRRHRRSQNRRAGF